MPGPHKTLAPALLLVAWIAAPALASGPFHYGVRAGVNASAFAGEFGDLVEPEPRYGPNVGVAFEYAFVPTVAMRAEVAYSSKGGRKGSVGTDSSGNPVLFPDAVWSFDYLEIPLLLRGRFQTGSGVTPFVELGPTLGFKLRGNIEQGLSGFPDLEVTDDMKTLDSGFGAGFGLDFPAGAGRMGIELRYVRGFGDLWTYDDNYSTINQAWTFALSWLR